MMSTSCVQVVIGWPSAAMILSLARKPAAVGGHAGSHFADHWVPSVGSPTATSAFPVSPIFVVSETCWPARSTSRGIGAPWVTLPQRGVDLLPGGIFDRVINLDDAVANFQAGCSAGVFAPT